MEDRLLVTLAPSIPLYLAKDNPGLDLSLVDIADAVVRSCDAGANVVHLHVRDKRGCPTTELATFECTVDLIRERCDIVIEGSTGGMNELWPSERSVSLEAGIEMARLHPGSVNCAMGGYVGLAPGVRHLPGLEQQGRGREVPL